MAFSFLFWSELGRVGYGSFPSNMDPTESYPDSRRIICIIISTSTRFYPPSPSREHVAFLTLALGFSFIDSVSRAFHLSHGEPGVRIRLELRRSRHLQCLLLQTRRRRHRRRSVPLRPLSDGFFQIPHLRSPLRS